MRIGINASFAREANTGIGQVTINFLRKLIEIKNQKSKIKNDFEIILYLEEDLAIDVKLPENFTKTIFLPFYKRDDLIRKVWWEKFLLPKKIKKDKCDIFISLYQCSTILNFSPFSKGRIKEGFKKQYGPKIPLNPPFKKGETVHLMLVHDIIPKLFPEYLNNSRKKLYWKLTEQAIKKANKIIAVSHRTEKDLVQHLGIDPAKIVVNYIDVDEIYKNQPRSSRDLHILEKYSLHPGYIYSGGGLEVRKNVEGVIRAYHHLYKKNKKVQYLRHFPKLVISGKLMPILAPLVTDAEKLVKELNLTEHVKLLDFVPQEDLPAIYRNAEFFIYPSFYEGFGLPVLEAMNVGTPVIVSKKSSLPEVGSDAVLYCKPDDIEDIVMVMKNLLINKSLRDTLSERGKERAKYFSWEKFVDKIFNIVHDRNF